ncbi:MAG: diaminopimelate decarboxylase, partial [Burkholderiales bacterium]
PVVADGKGGQPYEIVGPVCESGDFLARERRLALHEGDLLAIMSAGAYGMSMSSNYNTRPRAAEVMADGAASHLIRQRETVEELMAREIILP